MCEVSVQTKYYSSIILVSTCENRGGNYTLKILPYKPVGKYQYRCNETWYTLCFVGEIEYLTCLSFIHNGGIENEVRLRKKSRISDLIKGIKMLVDVKQR